MSADDKDNITPSQHGNFNISKCFFVLLRNCIFSTYGTSQQRPCVNRALPPLTVHRSAAA